MAASTAGVKAGRAFILIEAVDKTAFVMKRIGNRMQQFGGRMASMGASMMQKSVAALLPAAFSVKRFASFDDSMRKVQARSMGTAEEMEELRQQAKELGRTTSFTASQVGELQAKLAQKGFNRRQIKAMTGDVLNLARAAGEGREGDTVLAADLLSGAMRAFKADAQEATKFADVFSSTVNNSNFSLEGLMDSFSKAAPIARQYGVSLEDTAATLAGMTNVNIEASMAGTAFRNLLLKVSDAAKRKDFNKNLKAMTGNTIDFVDQAGNLRNIPEILFAIGEATKGLGSSQKGELLSELFGLRAIVPALAVSDGANDFASLSAILEEADGTAARTAKTMDEGLGGSFRKTLSALEGLVIAIGEALDGPLSGLLAWLTNVVGGLTEWIGRNQQVIVIVTAVIAGIGIFGGALLALGTAISIAGAAITGLATIIGVLKAVIIGTFVVVKAIVLAIVAVFTTPLGLAVVAIGSVVAAILYFTGAIGKAKDAAVGAFSTIWQTAMSFLQPVIRIFKALVKAFQAGDLAAAAEIGWAAVKVVWVAGTNFLMSTWMRFRVWVLNMVTTTYFGMLKTAVTIWTRIQQVWAVAFETVVSLTQTNAGRMILLFIGIMNPILGIIGLIIAFKDKIAAAFFFVVDVIKGVVEWFNNLIKTIASYLLPLLEKVGKVMNLIGGAAAKKFSELRKSITENVKAGVIQVGQELKLDEAADRAGERVGELEAKRQDQLAALEAEKNALIEGRNAELDALEKEQAAELARANAELEAALQKVEQGKEEAAEEVGEAIEDKGDELQDKLKGLIGDGDGVDAGGRIASDELNRGLEAGSIEAAQQFQKNRMNTKTALDAQLEEQKKAAKQREDQIKLLENIDEDLAMLQEIGLV